MEFTVDSLSQALENVKASHKKLKNRKMQKLFKILSWFSDLFV
jgi:hypothetical protein